MNHGNNNEFGWRSSHQPHSCDYLGPQILALLSQFSPRRVADIGAGNGALCSSISDQGYQTVGVEIDKEGFEIARQQYPHIPFYNFAVEDDPKHLLDTEKPFDVVISTEVVEHLYAPHLLPMYAGEILTDNGILIISTPYHGYLKNLVLALSNKWDNHLTALWHGGHIKFWSRKTLTALLEKNGFRVISFKGAGRIPWLWKSMLLVAMKNT